MSELPSDGAIEPSDSVDESFLAEEFTVGETKVVFKEEGQPAPEDVTPAVQEGAKVGSDFWNNDDDWVATVVGQTAEGKTLQVKKREGGSGYSLCFREGGQLDNLYSGWYTSFDKAKDAAVEYLNVLEAKSAETANA